MSDWNRNHGYREGRDENRSGPPYRQDPYSRDWRDPRAGEPRAGEPRAREPRAREPYEADYRRSRSLQDRDSIDRDYRRFSDRGRRDPRELDDRDGWSRMSERDGPGYPGPFGWVRDPDVDRNLDRDYYPAWDWNRGQRLGAERTEDRNWVERVQDRGGDRAQPHDRGRSEGVVERVRAAGHNLVSRVKRAFRGPKGYRRSDERIREDVNDRLADQDYFDPSEIEVQVMNSEVTLIGWVRSRDEKFLAEELADDVSGVTEVHNQLRVRRDPSSVGSSAGANVQTGQALGAEPATEASRNRSARPY